MYKSELLLLTTDCYNNVTNKASLLAREPTYLDLAFFSTYNISKKFAVHTTTQCNT